MSTAAVVDFINWSDSDSDVQHDLRETRGAEAVVRLAGERGYDFTAQELGRVTSLLSFVKDLWTAAELRAAVTGATDDAAVARIAAEHGYTFTAEDLAVVALAEEDELAEQELETVAGGVGGVPDARGLRVVIASPTQRTPSDTSFGAMLAQASSEGSLSASSSAAPFVPGGAVISAAISGVRVGGGTGPSSSRSA